MKPQIIFVVGSELSDSNRLINQEVAMANYLMSFYPDHIYLCRGAFIQVELMHPRPKEEWAQAYRQMIERSDALYAIDPNVAHPLIAWAKQIGVPVLGDTTDLEMFVMTQVQS